jgi:hypothetical protein
MGSVTDIGKLDPGQNRVDEIKFDTEMILNRLDAVKKQVEETQALQNQLLVPILAKA